MTLQVKHKQIQLWDLADEGAKHLMIKWLFLSGCEAMTDLHHNNGGKAFEAIMLPVWIWPSAHVTKNLKL